LNTHSSRKLIQENGRPASFGSVSKEEFTEFALHTYSEDFAISKIEAVPLQAEGKVSLYLESEMTEKTSPPTMMVYLPILDNMIECWFKQLVWKRNMCRGL